MRKLLLLFTAPLLLALPGCATLANLPPSPSAAADTTILDERGALSVEYAYSGLALALETLVDAGVLTGDDAARAARYDRQAYAAVQAVRAAYRTGNAESYGAAIADAREAIAAALAAFNGE